MLSVAAVTRMLALKKRVVDHQTDANLTNPVFFDATEVWFSACGVGWGYQAFAISIAVVLTELGATGLERTQLELAFRHGRHRIVHAIFGTLAINEAVAYASSCELLWTMTTIRNLIIDPRSYDRGLQV